MLDLEEQIIEKAYRRLLTNTREFKELDGIGVVSIGCLARVVALKQAAAIVTEVSCSELDAVLDRSGEKDLRKDECTFTDFTLAAPLLVYAEADGRRIMVDGDRRLRQLLKRGAPTVLLVTLERATVERFRIADPVVSYYRTLQRTENWPIKTVQAKNFRNAAVVQIASDNDPKPRGGQPLSNVDLHIRNTFYFFAATYLDLEWFVYNELPSEAVFDVKKHGNDLHRDVVNQNVYDNLRLECAFLPTLNTIVNKVGGANYTLTGQFGHAAAKRHSLAEWKNMLDNDKLAFDKERANARLICLALWKARWRLTTWTLAQWKLVDQDFHKNRLTRGDVANLVESQDRYSATELDFDEQRLLTQITGINMSRTYEQLKYLDPLFEAYAFAYHYIKSGEVSIDPGMIETALNRRALTILGQKDAFSNLWSDLFEYWSSAQIDDATIFKILEAADAAYAHYEPAAVRAGDLRR